MDVRHALADARICRDERPVRTEPALYRDRHAPHNTKERAEERVGEVVERLDVSARDDERVSVKERAPVEERDDVLVAMDHVRRDLAAHDLAEHAVRAHRRRTSSFVGAPLAYSTRTPSQ